MRFEIRYFFLEVGLSQTEGGGQKSVNRKILLFGIFLFNDSHNLCGNNCSHKFVGSANRDPISCSHNPCGDSAVPTKLVMRFLVSGTGK